MEIKKIHFTVKKDVKEQTDFKCYQDCLEWFRSVYGDVNTYPPCFTALTHKGDWDR